MLFSPYDFADFGLIAAIASLLALMLHLLDAYFGALRLLQTPLDGVRALLARAVTKLDRRDKDSKTRQFRGRLFLILWCFLGLIIAYALVTLLAALPRHDWVETVLLSLLLLCISPMKAATSSDQIRQRIEGESLKLFYRSTLLISFWLIASWLGVVLILVLTLMIEVLHTQKRLHSPFGRSVLRISHMLFYVPLLIHHLLIAAAAIVTSRCRPRAALQNGFAHAINHPKAVIASSAGAVHITLGGPASAISKDWIGTGTAQLQQADFKRWRFLSFTARGCLAFLLLVVSLL